MCLKRKPKVDLQPMLIRKDELKEAIVEAFGEIESRRNPDELEAVIVRAIEKSRIDHNPNSMVNLIRGFLDAALFGVCVGGCVFFFIYQIILLVVLYPLATQTKCIIALATLVASTAIHIHLVVTFLSIKPIRDGSLMNKLTQSGKKSYLPFCIYMALYFSPVIFYLALRSQINFNHLIFPIYASLGSAILRHIIAQDKNTDGLMAIFAVAALIISIIKP